MRKQNLNRIVMLSMGLAMVLLTACGGPATMTPPSTVEPTETPTITLSPPETPKPRLPADWTPLPPPEQADDWRDWLQGYVRLFTNILNATGDVDAALDHLVAWMPEDTFAGPRPESAWAEAHDVDDDGADEWLVSLPGLYEGCSIAWCPGYVVLFEKQDGLFTPVYLIHDDGGSYQLSYPAPFTVADINADGQTELVVQSYSCGAHTCVTSLVIGRWDGERWRDLTADAIEQASSKVRLEDRDGDGIQEIIMHGGIINSAGAGLQRECTLVFDWRDGVYCLAERIPDPSDHPYYRILDANATLADGNLEESLALAMDVVNLSGYEGSIAMGGSEDSYNYAWPRIVAYASSEAMLVHAQRDDVQAMKDVLFGGLMVRSFAALNDPYPQAAWRLLEVYQETGDPLSACQAMEAFVAERAADAPFFKEYGYGTERITLDRLCPLDESPETPGPEL